MQTTQHTTYKTTPQPLQHWRNEIDTIDAEILEYIAQRIEIVKKVGEYKKENNMPFLDATRRDQILENKMKLAKEKDLCPDLTKNLYTLLHDYSLSIEEKL